MRNMAVVKFILVFSTFIACSNSENATTIKSTPEGIASRFFDFGGIINQLFPGLNQGNGAPGFNTPGMDYPANSQYYPNVPIQGQDPKTQTGQGGTWPVIDDASQFPNSRPDSRPQPYPGLTNPGSYPQFGNPTYPNQGPPNGNFPTICGVGLNPQTPPQGGLTSPLFPQNPSQGNSMNQNPGQGNLINKNPNQGIFMNQNPNQGNFMIQNPNQGTEGQILFPQYPSIGSAQNQNPIQGGWNQGNLMKPGAGGDGTLDGIKPPERDNLWNSDLSNNYDDIGDANITPSLPDSQFSPDNFGGGSNGRDVIVPITTPEPGRIFYPESSTDNASLKQCVQDCQTDTEYDPVCGSDDVTYINPGKFVCARNCGVNVYVVRSGSCSKL